MLACKQGKEEVIKFLLQSAVYANQLGHDDGYVGFNLWILWLILWSDHTFSVNKADNLFKLKFLTLFLLTIFETHALGMHFFF